MRGCLHLVGGVGIMVQFLACLHQVLSIDSRNIVFVIVSQTSFFSGGFNTTKERHKYITNYRDYLIVDSMDKEGEAVNPYKDLIEDFENVDSRAAKELKNDLNNQVMSKEQRHPIVHITNEDFPISGTWTIIPLLRPLLDKYEISDVRWVLFIEPHTVVKYPKLIEVLEAADKKARSSWTGYLLRHATNNQYRFDVRKELILTNGLPYPNFASGFAMNIKLIQRLGRRKATFLRSHFPVITYPSFSLACFVYDDEYNNGPLFKHTSGFCAFPGDDCATYPRKFDICGEAELEKSIYFAVKTWHGNHNTMAKLVRRTWGQYVSNLMFYSDVADPSLPAIITGVPNVKGGHYCKTLAILKHAVNVTRNTPHIKWITLIDDDALLGVKRLCEILSCYRDERFTVLGERFKMRSDITTEGNDFITGGSGIIFSITAARYLLNCECEYPDLTDDLMLGYCAALLGLSLSHSPLFHQYFPEYYQEDVLKRDRPVSFHGCRSWNIPRCYDVYDQWFRADDIKLQRRRSKDEL